MKALIAMSGGVDSSVAAYLALQEGYECVSATMHLHGSSAVDSGAEQIARRLGLAHQNIDFSRQFEELVIRDFVRCYEAGLTPNPCVQCNRHLKFRALLDYAQSIGCGRIVTGHYARICRDEATGRYRLKKAADAAKDQSYFLCMLDQEQLGSTLLPLGALTKEQVRAIAAAQGFSNAGKKDSQDICFIPDGDHLSFIRGYTGKTYPAGSFLDLTGNPVGSHQGAVGYTLGQRKGLGIALGEPVYVCSKDMTANTVTVGPNEALFRKSLLAADWNWISISSLTEPLRVSAKARSRMTEQPATVYPMEGGLARVEFDEPQRALTPGQTVALYRGDSVVGGGTITQTI